MYVETVGNPIGSKMPVKMQQVAQTDVSNTIHAESTEGKAEYKNYESTTRQSTAETTSVADRQAAENEKVKKAIEKMNAQLPHSEAKFGIHEETNRVMIKLVDKETQEVIKEIPPEKTLDMIAKCMEIAGVLMDEKL